MRLVSPAYTGEGTLVRLGANALEVGIEGRARSISVPIESVTRLEYRRPATTVERMTRGALWGAGTLGVAGFLISDRPEGTSEVEVAVSAALAGALWGSIISFLVPQSRWEGVDLEAWANRVP